MCTAQYAFAFLCVISTPFNDYNIRLLPLWIEAHTQTLFRLFLLCIVNEESIKLLRPDSAILIQGCESGMHEHIGLDGIGQPARAGGLP